MSVTIQRECKHSKVAKLLATMSLISNCAIRQQPPLHETRAAPNLDFRAFGEDCEDILSRTVEERIEQCTRVAGINYGLSQTRLYAIILTDLGTSKSIAPIPEHGEFVAWAATRDEVAILARNSNEQYPLMLYRIFPFRDQHAQIYEVGYNLGTRVPTINYIAHDRLRAELELQPLFRGDGNEGRVIATFSQNNPLIVGTNFLPL